MDKISVWKDGKCIGRGEIQSENHIFSNLGDSFTVASEFYLTSLARLSPESAANPQALEQTASRPNVKPSEKSLK